MVVVDAGSLDSQGGIVEGACKRIVVDTTFPMFSIYATSIGPVPGDFVATEAA
jgi:hypothetical protein